MLILITQHDLPKITHLPDYVQESAAFDLRREHCVVIVEDRAEMQSLADETLRDCCCIPPKGRLVFERPDESYMYCPTGSTVFYLPYAFTDLLNAT